MSRIRRFLDLDAADRGTFVRAALWLVAFRVGLLVLPLRVLSRVAVGGAPEPPAAPAESAAREARRVRWAVAAAARRVPGARCLTQALAAQRLLARSHPATELRFGARRGPRGAFEAHAWLEQGGVVVFGDPQPQRFRPLTGERTRE